jgi:hypothetical protein
VVTIVIAVAVPPVSPVVMVARAVVTVIVDTSGLSASLGGVLCIMIRPEAALDR